MTQNTDTTTAGESDSAESHEEEQQDEYKHATVIQLTSPDPRNGHEVGTEIVRAGLYEDGDDYRVRDGQEEVEVETETVEIYTFDSPVSKEAAIDAVFESDPDEVLD